MASMQEEIEKYKGQVRQYDAGRPDTSAPQPAPSFKGGEVVGSPEPDAASRAIGAAGRGISKVGESMSGTSGGVAMRGPEIRGNMPNSAQLQDKPFNYEAPSGSLSGLASTMAETSGAIRPLGQGPQYVNKLREPISRDVMVSAEKIGGDVTPLSRQAISAQANPESAVAPGQPTVWPQVGDAIA